MKLSDDKRERRRKLLLELTNEVNINHGYYHIIMVFDFIDNLSSQL